MQHSSAGEANRSSDSQEIPSILYKPRVNCLIDNCQPFCLYPVHASLYLLILFYHLRLGFPSGLFPSGVHTKPFVNSCHPYVLYALPIYLFLICSAQSHMSTAVPADAHCYVTQCYRHTPEGLSWTGGLYYFCLLSKLSIIFWKM